MNLLITWIITFQWDIITSLQQLPTIEPSKILKSSILKTYNTPSITGCWLKCLDTAGCVAIGTSIEAENETDSFFDCYLQEENRDKYENEHMFFDIYKIRPVSLLAVSSSRIFHFFFTFMNFSIGKGRLLFRTPSFSIAVLSKKISFSGGQTSPTL